MWQNKDTHVTHTNCPQLTLSTPNFVKQTCSSLKLFMYSCSNRVLNLTFFKASDPARGRKQTSHLDLCALNWNCSQMAPQLLKRLFSAWTPSEKQKNGSAGQWKNIIIHPAALNEVVMITWPVNSQICPTHVSKMKMRERNDLKKKKKSRLNPYTWWSTVHQHGKQMCPKSELHFPFLSSLVYFVKY